MEKILKKYTKIPSHLYVQRNADNQLKNIIDEMERPGYVLVARQMGKTNLLLNAKRELEDKEHLFAYIDFSTVFEEKRDCYRNIINMIIEPNLSLFENIASKIFEKREKSNLPANIEYLQELRLVLNEFKGKIIIILDEIDALTSADYSDQIFAQIRSNYFASRTNFPEFNNLTYVLSGVIEPTELIKDKNKSPFNIGEKIYLDDFSIEEHYSFIKKSKMKLDNNIIDYIYSWTNGNPRLNFDICSNVEDLIIENKIITKIDIDNIVNKIYLTNFDTAPIDHIRELVKEDKGIRNAVVKLQKGLSTISDDIKDKLYLAGIINSEFTKENIQIKNRIISKSLSLEWINSIELQSSDLFYSGLDHMDIGQYEDAITLLTKYLNSVDNIEAHQKKMVNYNIGYAYNKLGDYVSSNKHLTNNDLNSEKTPSYYYMQKLLIGLNYIAINSDYDKALPFLEEIIENYKTGTPYFNALLHIGKILINKNEKDTARSLFLFDELLTNIDDKHSDDLSEEEINKLKLLALYYSSEIYLLNKDDKKAIEYYIKAQKYTSIEHMPFFKNAVYFLSVVKDENLIIETVDIIINNKIEFKSVLELPFDFTEMQLYTTFHNLIKIENTSKFNKLLDYAKNNLFDKSLSKNNILLNIGLSSIDVDVADKVYRLILSEKETINDKYLLEQTYRQLSIINNDTNYFPTYFSEYYKTFNGDEFSIDDLTVFAYAIRYYNGRANFLKALEICNKIENLLSKLDAKLKFDSLVIYFWITKTYNSINDKENSLKYSNVTLNLINEAKTKGNKLSLLNEEGITTIKNQMEQVISIYTPNTPFIRSKKIGRNDFVKVRYYADNVEKEGKYKKFIYDIENGKCEIIETTR